MRYKVNKTSLVTLKPNDPDFLLKDQFVVSARAGFEIDSRCPDNYKIVIRECLQNGWLKPVATVYDHEITFARMKYE
jgi:hypothetical protein